MLNMVAQFELNWTVAINNQNLLFGAFGTSMKPKLNEKTKQNNKELRVTTNVSE